MRLGTRWPADAEPPARLPAAIVRAIRSVEAELTDAERPGWRWQLTWLEGLPHVEADAGLVIRYDPAADAAVVLGPDDLHALGD
ncbi:MAG: hypothetical protein QM635_00740 [Microbacteriaceae bacterium]